MSSHWYKEDGTTAYTQIVQSGPRKGLERDTTLADAKKQRLYKSVTTVLGLPAKPQLITWLNNQILDAVLEHGIPYKNTEEDVKRWKGKILQASQKVGRDSAELGSKIHDALEQMIIDKSLSDSHELYDFLNPVWEQLWEEFKGKYYTFIPEASFGCSKMRLGGKVDLHSKEGDGFILDFKTKNKEVVDKKTPYFENCMQLAAYRMGLGLPKARCYNLYISTVKPGAVYLHEWTEPEIQKAEKMFLLLNEYFDLSNGLI